MYCHIDCLVFIIILIQYHVTDQLLIIFTGNIALKHSIINIAINYTISVIQTV